MLSIEKNLDEVRKKIKHAAQQSGRNESDIVLVGVTKTISVDKIQNLLQLGVKDFGENKVQELNEKHSLLPSDVSWHFIGHMQTNKVKHVLGKVKLIHSVDSEKLVLEIYKQALNKNITADILLEINIANEETKFGVSPKDAIKLAQFIDNFDNIRLKGIMTVAPYVETPKKNAKHFAHMKDVFIDIVSKISNNRDMQFLSMGMSNDYEVAIHEGANMIRVGTSIFGERT